MGRLVAGVARGGTGNPLEVHERRIGEVVDRVEVAHGAGLLESDPRESWDRFVAYGDDVKASGLARIVLAAPFFATLPGTDRYTDELW